MNHPPPNEINLLHTADLHLNDAQKAYGMAVLADMVSLAQQHQVDGCLFCGDIFDTFKDAQQLAAAFAEALAPLQGKALCLIAGNHELLGAPGDTEAEKREAVHQALAPLRQAGIEVATALGHTRFDWPHLGLEAFAHPFQTDLRDVWKQAPSAKISGWRVGLFHGALQGLNYTGESEEAQHAVLDPALFQHLGLDYAALGHIHRRGEQNCGDCVAHQPGSPRVWRRGESGVRYVSRIRLHHQGRAQIKAIPVVTAGRWVRIPLTLQEGGLYHAQTKEMISAQAYLKHLSQHYTPNDWLELCLEGLAERPQADEVKRQLEHEAKASAKGYFRNVTVQVNENALIETATLHQQPLARAFEARWQQRLAALQAEAEAQGVVLNAHTSHNPQLEEGPSHAALYLKQWHLLHRARRLFLETLHHQIGP